MHKTDYIRLKNIELGYTVPSIWSKKIGVEHLRVYINAYNLLTISPDMKDYDPENTSGSGYNYPLNKSDKFWSKPYFLNKMKNMKRFIWIICIAMSYANSMQ